MNALTLVDYRKFEYGDVADPGLPGQLELIVKVSAVGICGSDVHGFTGSTGRRVPPIIMGHEASGIIVEVGDQVTEFKPGQRVTFDSTISCGNCDFCRAGQENLCQDRRVLGVSCSEYRQNGAFAQLIRIPSRIAYKLPDALSFEHAALIEPVSVAFHAVRRTNVKLGCNAVVIGAGMIGQMTIQALRASGCNLIACVDLDKSRLTMALAHGADVTIDVNETSDVAARVCELTCGRGADVVFDAVGTAQSVRNAVHSARKGGTVTLIGNVTPVVDIPLQAVVTRELSLLGTCASAGEYKACLDMMARGSIQVAPFISALVPLKEAPSWFERLHNREPGILKVLLQPN